MTRLRIIHLSQIRRWQPCTEQYFIVAERYPKGVPLTMEAADALMIHGVDVVWGLLHLLGQRDRPEFILFTLRQRQQHLVALLRQAKLPIKADALAALTLETLEDADLAKPLLDAARAVTWAPGEAARVARVAAWAARFREQALWIINRLGGRET